MNDRSRLDDHLEQRIRDWGDEQLGAPPPSAALWQQLAGHLPARPHHSGERFMSISEQPPIQAPAAPTRTHQTRRGIISVAAVVLIITASIFLFQTLHATIGDYRSTKGTPTNTPTPSVLLSKTELTNIAMVSPQEGWSAGAILDPTGQQYIQGVILHYQHGSWQKYQTNLDLAKIDLGRVHMLSSNDGWIEGTIHSCVLYCDRESIGSDDDAGVIFLHYINGQWQQVPIPLTAPLKLGDIVPVSDQESWILGDTQAPGDNGECCSLLLHEVHGTWAKVPIPPAYTTFHFNLIAPVSPDDAWLNADDNSSGTVMVHYQHGTWSQQIMPGNGGLSILSIQMLSARDGWASGNSFGRDPNPPRDPYLIHYDGSSWKTEALPAGPDSQTNEGQFLQSISFDAPNDGWITGISVVPINTTLFYRYVRGTWQHVQVSFPSYLLPKQPSGSPIPPNWPENPFVSQGSVTSVAPNDAWAVVTAGVPPANTPPTAGYSPIYRSFIFHYDGISWTLVQQ